MVLNTSLCTVIFRFLYGTKWGCSGCDQKPEIQFKTSWYTKHLGCRHFLIFFKINFNAVKIIWTNFKKHTKYKIHKQITKYINKLQNAWPNYKVHDKIIKYMTKLQIRWPNYKYMTKLQIRWPNYKYMTNYKIDDQITNTWPNYKYMTKLQNAWFSYQIIHNYVHYTIKCSFYTNYVDLGSAQRKSGWQLNSLDFDISQVVHFTIKVFFQSQL